MAIGTNESLDDEHLNHQTLANVRFFDAHALALANALKLELVAKHYSVTIDPYLKDSYAIVTVVAREPTERVGGKRTHCAFEVAMSSGRWLA